MALFIPSFHHVPGAPIQKKKVVCVPSTRQQHTTNLEKFGAFLTTKNDVTFLAKLASPLPTTTKRDGAFPFEFSILAFEFSFSKKYFETFFRKAKLKARMLNSARPTLEIGHKVG